MGVAGLVLGIVSVVIGLFIPGIGWLGLVTGIVGIILSALAIKAQKASINTAGLVLSIIGTAMSLIFWIACALCAAVATTTSTIF